VIGNSLIPSEPWRRNQYAVLVSVFISFMGFSFVIPFMPLYIRELGVTDVNQAAFLAGIAFGVAPLFSGLLAPLWGRLADRHGVKVMVQRALISFAILNGLMALVDSPYQLLALRAGIGLFGGFGPMTASLVTIGAPRHEIGPAIGKLQATQILATAIGPLLGGIVADTLGIRVAFISTAIFCAIAFALITALYRQEPGRALAARANRPLTMRGLLSIPGFLPLLAILFLAQMVDRGVGPIMPLFIQVLDSTVPVASTAGLVVSAGALVSAVAASQVGRISARRDARRLLLISLIIGLAATAPLVIVHTLPELIGLRLLFGLAAGTTATLTYSAAARAVPEESRTTAFGFLGSASSFATAVGPFSVGALSTLDLRIAFAALALFYGIAIVIALVSSRSRFARGANAAG
jgi:DHA1 family multidrug resistance protein-like MFS transporter